jgi:hypothetical protein
LLSLGIKVGRLKRKKKILLITVLERRMIEKKILSYALFFFIIPVWSYGRPIDKKTEPIQRGHRFVHVGKDGGQDNTCGLYFCLLACYCYFSFFFSVSR